jgi:hypothetical protein
MDLGSGTALMTASVSSGIAGLHLSRVMTIPIARYRSAVQLARLLKSSVLGFLARAVSIKNFPPYPNTPGNS